MPTSKRIEAIVSGKVQGVCFRSCTASKSRELGLSGYAKNLSDETVEVIAEGSEKKLLELVSWLHKGPSHARVDDVKVAWSDSIEEFRDFIVK